MSDEFEAVMRQLRLEYLAEVPERVGLLRQAIEGFAAGDAARGDEIYRLFHQLTGSAGSYGFDEASAIARELEHWMKTGPAPSADAGDQLRAGIEKIERIFERARQEIGAG